MEHEKLTTVIFRVWVGKDSIEGQSDVVALFPEECANRYGDLCQSFEHVGQHGSADCRGVIARTRPATPAEYKSLKRELESPPYEYRFRVVRRVSRKMDMIRRMAS